ncbi:sodium/potassium/calcium exchanger 5-like isoform X1 [Asterias amurensis]|uniref:sodium/potassium/calcium exchanger 5-like isoform X1 n=1 Tax=Asterias amurensis TaxID=7602 RepID=UPI003AB63928
MAIWTGRRRKSSMFKSAICGTYICIVIVYASVLILYGFIDQIVKFSDGGEYVVARKRLVQETTVGTQEILNVTGSTSPTVTDDSLELIDNCTTPSIDNFPSGLFSVDSLRRGALSINVIAVVYIFGALAIVCDSYFMPALEIICSVLNLSEDVAGATFMAIGGSAPELFTSVIGVFISKGDIGVGTILGSAVFNVLFVIGLCGLLAGKAFDLSCWPLTRDSCCYIISILALVFVVADGLVVWSESLVLLILYALYITLMYFNPPTERYVNRKMSTCRCKKLAGVDGRRGVTGEPRGDFTELANLMEEGEGSDEDDEEVALHMVNGNGSLKKEDKKERSQTRDEGTFRQDEDEEDPKSPLEIPKGCLQIFSWSLTLPALLLFYVTIPDCRKKAWARWYPVTFLVALAWIAGLTYVLVWMVTIVGFVLEIPDTVMGLTLLAAGSSVPDLILSVIAAREGYGDMAISHSIGSNLFDILLGLGLPWFLSSIVVSGRPVVIHSSGVIYITAMLLGNVVITVVLIRANGFILNKKLGFLLVVLYVVFLVLSIFFEMHSILGMTILPLCT